MSTHDDEFDDHDEEETPEPRRRSRPSGFEGLLRDSFRKAVERGLEAGMGTLRSADTVVRGVVGESNTVGKEISGYLFSQIDETKNVLIRAVAKEVRDFLDTTDLSSELQRALTALSFEIKMEVRFVPNKAGELEPRVRTRGVPRATRRERERERAEREADRTDSEATAETARETERKREEERKRTLELELERVEERKRALEREEERMRALERERDREEERKRALERERDEERKRAQAAAEVAARIPSDEAPDDEDE